MKNQDKFKIRPGTAADFPAIFQMIQELALFEKAPEKVINSAAQMEAEQDCFRTLVVEDVNGTVIAFALYYFAYYTWVGKSLYLDDLYVKEDCRGSGIGTRLLTEIFKIGEQENCKRIRWQVLDWNEPAIALYRKMGLTLDNEWINCDKNLV